MRRIAKFTSYVASTTGFNGQPEVMNDTSDILGELFGEKGLHTRTVARIAKLPSIPLSKSNS